MWANLDLMESKLFRILFSWLIGAGVGVCASFVVNCTLVEISINTFFATYFGLLFLLIGGGILYRIRSGNHPQPLMLMVFSGMVIFSGLLCFILRKNWFVLLSPHMKLPLYSILGISICFALLFSLVDLVNLAGSYFSNSKSRALVESERQVYLVVVASIIMGFAFGYIFGLLDVEDEKFSHIKIALMKEESLCYPIGAVVGGVASSLNQHWRDEQPEYQFNPLNDTDLLDDEDF